jgi:phosphomannomutase/phosphoglucomutase
MTVFKACDIRGHYGTELTPAFAERLGMAVGAQLGGDSVLVGGDLRPSTKALQQALTRGLLHTGCHVLDVGTVPTPAFYFAKNTYGITGGVMVTGSHNPPGDNGFKVTLGRWPITPEEINGLRHAIKHDDFSKSPGRYTQRDVLPAYEASLQGRFSSTGDQHIVVDAGNGGYAKIAPRVISSLGYQVSTLFDKPDGTFPNRPPNPAIQEHIEALQQKVVRVGADLGVAYDGDGDRAVFVDDNGRFVVSDHSFVLLIREQLRDRPGKVVYDIKCSRVVAEATREVGGEPIMERSGHAFIKRTLLETNALLGGEISGHFFFGELGYDDALYATLVMLNILGRDACIFSALVDSVPHYPITPDIRLPCPPSKAAQIIEELHQAFIHDPTSEVNTLDGVRIDWKDGWALARPSVTEPLITLRFEAQSQDRLIALQELILSQSATLRSLEMPLTPATP